jgi:cytosine/adenosine deaminase-related metal-dependent hydrolase
MSSGSSSQLLLKDGLILIHDSQNHVVPTRGHVLIEGGTIIKIGPDVEASKGAEVVDCTDKIVSPGFVDTHHHGWQTQLKGRHANEQLLQYMVTGEFKYDSLLPPC